MNSRQRKKFIEQIPELQKCFQCGTCTAACYASWYIKRYSPRDIVLQCLNGNERVMSDNLWKCITCNRCNELCPQGVNPYDVIVRLKNLAFEYNLISPELKERLIAVFDNILETGNTFDINEAVQRHRKEMGLNEIKFDNKDLKKLFAAREEDKDE